MRARTKVAVGGGLTTALTLLGLTVAGVATTTAVVALDPLAPAANADALQRFDDCADLLTWYRDRAVADVGAYGWNDGVAIAYAGTGLLEDQAAVVPGTSAPDGARTSSATGTNTQEADVDEPDVAKTDGRVVVRLTTDGALVVTDVHGSHPRDLARIDLPGEPAYDAELLLVGGHALVLSSDTTYAGGVPGGPTDLLSGRTKIRVPSGTQLVDVDLSDPSAPALAHVEWFSGRLVSARSYGGTVRLVTASSRPDLAWTYPSDKVSEREAIARNRALVRATTLDDWLPTVTGDGQRRRLLDCGDVLHPRSYAGSETLAVTTFGASDVTARSSVGLTATAQVVYSSADRLYVASTRWDDVRRGAEPDGPAEPRLSLPIRPTPPVTDLHAFALDGTHTRFVASGSVDGAVRDRWSLDEQDGVLRVAWTRGTGTGRTSNGISTFAERDGTLSRVGELGDLGLDEDLRAVRWLGDLAVLVTFRQVDPLYTVDLTDPADPRMLGALKIPGYSGYLHPLGDHLLLGLGVDAGPDGRGRGAQAAVFDITDPSRPVRVSRLGFGPESALTAVDEPRAFTWLPEARTAVTTVQPFSSPAARLVGIGVDSAGALTDRDLATGFDGYRTRVLPLGDGRVAVAANDVRVLDLG